VLTGSERYSMSSRSERGWASAPLRVPTAWGSSVSDLPDALLLPLWPDSSASLKVAQQANLRVNGLLGATTRGIFAGNRAAVRRRDRNLPFPWQAPFHSGTPFRDAPPYEADRQRRTRLRRLSECLTG
jgi:hypothetical protein